MRQFRRLRKVAHLEEARQHLMGQDDGLELALDLGAILARQHVHLPLVQPQLADVCLPTHMHVS